MMATNWEWIEFIVKHNSRPNLRSAVIWALDELFWRIRYLIGDANFGGKYAREYWENDILTCWRRSYKCLGTLWVWK